MTCTMSLCSLVGIHRLKQSMPKRKAGKMAKSYDPIAPVAAEISEEACLLCFDEFQVFHYIDSYNKDICQKKAKQYIAVGTVRMFKKKKVPSTNNH